MQNKSIAITLVEFLTPLALFLTPLLFLPLTPNFFATPQQIFVIAIVLILLVGLTLDILLHRSLPLSLSALRLPLIVFVGATIANLLANPESRTEALASQGSLYLALAILSYFLSLVPRTAKLKTHSVMALISASTLLALHGLLQLTLLHSWTVLPSFMQDRGFTPTGSPLITFAILLIGSIVAFASSPSRTSSLAKYLSIAAGTLSLITAIAYLSLMLPGAPLAPLLLPLTASWNIMLDSFKNTHNLIFGVGLANFSELYTSVKPLFLNATPFWNILPSTASTEVFQWITTTGLLGAGAFLYLIAAGGAQIVKNQSHLSPLSLVFMASSLALFLMPASVPLYLLFFASLGLLSSQGSENLPVQKGASYLLTLILATLIGYSGFYVMQVARAEYSIRQAKVALSKNDAKTVYESNLRAVQLVPTMTSYRLSYSQVNLSLAAALSQKTQLTDEEKTNISQLVSQSIREGKIVTSLRPHDASSWRNLGNIYTNLLTVADGSDQFALDAYAQAVALDAGNPALRTEFGNLLVQLSQTTKVDADKLAYQNRAGSEFQTAIQLKADYPSAYYNLAKLFESTGNYSNAALALQKAISLLPPSDPDLARATSELETLKTKVPAPSPSPSPSASPAQ